MQSLFKLIFNSLSTYPQTCYKQNQ
jgi:hypothetical protein